MVKKFGIYSYGQDIIAQRLRYNRIHLIQACMFSFLAGFAAMAFVVAYLIAR